MTAVMDKLANYPDAFDRFVAARASREPSWLLELRRRAIARLRELGFPTTSHEDWRWTNTATLMGTAVRWGEPLAAGSVPLERIDRFSFGGLDAVRLVLLNGHYAHWLSDASGLPAGVSAGGLLAAASDGAGAAIDARLGGMGLEQSRSFAALNAAFLSDGALVRVPAGVTVPRPIHVLCLTTSPGESIVTHPRNLIEVGPGAEATVIESYAVLDGGVYFTNPVTEVFCGEQARVNHYRLQRESEAAFHVAATAVHMGAGSRYRATAVNLGGALVRNEVHVRLDGERCDCNLEGISLGRGSQLLDTHTRLDHAKPYCESHQVFKSVLDDESRAVFDGRILVRREAQKTDAKQTARNLLLSDRAIAQNKPQLEIYADDVKCTHGATTGALDDSQVFYLRARGLDADSARTLLTYAFACQITQGIELESVRTDVEHEFLERLPMGKLVKEAL